MEKKPLKTIAAPEICHSALTEAKQYDESDEAHEDHPPYIAETIKRGIIEGLDPTGESLDWVMPRWQMAESDLNDLIDFLQTFGQKPLHNLQTCFKKALGKPAILMTR